MKKKLLLKIFLIFLLPIIIYFWLFSSLNPYNYQFEKRNNVNVLNSDCPSIKCSFRQILNIPFKSDYYKFCFVDNGRSKSYPYFAQLINGENIASFNITSKGEYCEIIDLKLGVKTLYEDNSFSSTLGEIEKNKTIILEWGIRDLKSKIKLEFWNGLAKLLLVFLAYWVIFFLLREVYTYLEKN